MAISVTLQVFEGPLDLLLFLIEKNKVDIYDIPISLITEQYMEYINDLKNRDMNVMSEFLVMAATLLDIKSKMLLPMEVNEEGEEEDPRAELVAQLLEYKKYKYLSTELKDMGLNAQKATFKKATIPDEIANYKPKTDLSVVIGDNTLSTLNTIFKDVMKRQVDKIDPIRSKFGNIEKEEIDISKKSSHILEIAKQKGSFSFRNLLEKQDSKMEVIVSFLIILEFIKIGVFSVEQEEAFSDINLTYHEENLPTGDIIIAE